MNRIVGAVVTRASYLIVSVRPQMRRLDGPPTFSTHSHRFLKPMRAARPTVHAMVRMSMEDPIMMIIKERSPWAVLAAFAWLGIVYLWQADWSAEDIAGALAGRVSVQVDSNDGPRIASSSSSQESRRMNDE
jgi:hypothetical protein